MNAARLCLTARMPARCLVTWASFGCDLPLIARWVWPDKRRLNDLPGAHSVPKSSQRATNGGLPGTPRSWLIEKAHVRGHAYE